MLLGGKPVSGASVSVDRYVLPRQTAADGSFTALVDSTLARRHPVTVSAGASARVSGRPLTDAEKATLKSATGGINVGFKIDGLSRNEAQRRHGQGDGAGRARRRGARAAGRAALLPPLGHDHRRRRASRSPGAYVVSRTNDRDYWMFSEPSNAAGKYVSFFPASDLTEADPVEFSIQAAVGPHELHDGRSATRRSSAAAAPSSISSCPRRASRCRCRSRPRCPARSTAARSIGVSAGTGVVRPISATWPDVQGRFQLDPAGVGCGQDAALLAERLPDLPDERRHARRRGRPEGVADGAVAARRARHRLPPRLEVERACTGRRRRPALWCDQCSAARASIFSPAVPACSRLPSSFPARGCERRHTRTRAPAPSGSSPPSRRS